MKKFGLLLLAVVLALGTMGVGYAMWYEDLFIEGTVYTGEVDWEFYNIYDPTQPPECTQDDVGVDPGNDKDVGSTAWKFYDTDGDGDYDTLEILVSNAYPFYRNHMSTWVHCNGTVPIIIVGAWVSFNDGPEIWMPVGQWVYNADSSLRVNFGDNYGDQLHFCDSRDISFAFELLQPAQQDAIYTFSIRYMAVQYNEYPLP